MVGCASNDRESPQTPTAPATPTGSGILTVSVVDTEGRPLDDAHVAIYDPARMQFLKSSRTGTNGLVTIDSLPAAVRVHVLHAYGALYQDPRVEVAQQGSTFLGVIVQPGRPRPTAALMPVSVPADAVSADRSELSLSVTVVASVLAPFNRVESSAKATPALGLTIGDSNDPRQCWVWLDSMRTFLTCGTPWGKSPYTVSV